jgi:hypothetical protein
LFSRRHSSNLHGFISTVDRVKSNVNYSSFCSVLKHKTEAFVLDDFSQFIISSHVSAL